MKRIVVVIPIRRIDGWHAGFGLAAIGMLAGNLSLTFGSNMLREKIDKGQPLCSHATAKGVIAIAVPLVVVALQYHFVVSMLFPLLVIAVCCLIYRELQGTFAANREKFQKLFVLLALMVIFYGCEEQLGSTLILFSERHVDRDFFSWNIPASSLIMFNPLTILLVGPLLSRLLERRALHDLIKVGISFALLSVAFGLLYGGCLATTGEMVSLYLVIGSIVLIAIGEILIGPTVYAAGSAAAPDSLQGVTMGIVTLGFALANLFSGFLSQLMAIDESGGVNSISVYSNGFMWITYGACGMAIVLLMVTFKFKKQSFLWKGNGSQVLIDS